jgi:hypothetical protein
MWATCPDTHTREVSAVIRIRYAELSCGLHVRTEAAAGQVTIWLQRGLSGSERRAALRRVRRSSRMGLGPDLPKAQLARALAADRLRTGAGSVVAVVRTHPALLTPLIVTVLAVGGYLFVASAPLRQHPELAGPGDRHSASFGDNPPSAISPAPPGGGGRGSAPGRGQHRPGPGHGPRPGEAPSPQPGPSSPPSQAPSPGPSPTPPGAHSHGSAPGQAHGHAYGWRHHHGPLDDHSVANGDGVALGEALQPPAPPGPRTLAGTSR